MLRPDLGPLAAMPSPGPRPPPFCSRLRSFLDNLHPQVSVGEDASSRQLSLGWPCPWASTGQHGPQVAASSTRAPSVDPDPCLVPLSTVETSPPEGAADCRALAWLWDVPHTLARAPETSLCREGAGIRVPGHRDSSRGLFCLQGNPADRNELCPPAWAPRQREDHRGICCLQSPRAALAEGEAPWPGTGLAASFPLRLSSVAQCVPMERGCRGPSKEGNQEMGRATEVALQR